MAKGNVHLKLKLEQTAKGVVGRRKTGKEPGGVVNKETGLGRIGQRAGHTRIEKLGAFVDKGLVRQITK